MVRVDKIGMASPGRRAWARWRATPSGFGLVGLVGALAACQPAPVLAPARHYYRPVAIARPAPEEKPQPMKHPAVPAPCGPADATGLSAAQKDALFRQFEAWQAHGGKPAGSDDSHPTATAPARASQVAAAADCDGSR
jgi:hypothetical protein